MGNGVLWVCGHTLYVMTCNQTLEALYDAALRASAETGGNEKPTSLPRHESPGAPVDARSDAGIPLDERSLLPPQSTAFASDFWGKTR